MTGLAEITIRNYEAGKFIPKIESLEKIAVALGVNISDLDPRLIPEHGFDFRGDIMACLDQLGHKVIYHEDDAILVMQFPDGELEISAADLEELADTTASYLEFKVQELRKNRPQDFRSGIKE